MSKHDKGGPVEFFLASDFPQAIHFVFAGLLISREMKSWGGAAALLEGESINACLSLAVVSFAGMKNLRYN
jgi:hypothetical protein